ncbi:MAG: hypothetical protein U0324_25140 [Polyangiales bacterium]
MPATSAPALSPLAPLGAVAGRYPRHAVEVIATGDPDRACLRVDDPPHHRVMLVDVPRGLVLAEDSLRQAPAPPPAGVRLGDPRWRVRTCNYGPDGDVRWLLAWIDPASARVLATVDRPHHAFDRDVVVRDDEVVLIGNTWHARDGGRLVAQGPAAKAVDDDALAPALDRAGPREAGALAAHLPRGPGAHVGDVEGHRAEAGRAGADGGGAERRAPDERTL